MPSFRIVVPVRQAEPWIARCLGSIRRQTVRDFRCVVIDDRSEDRTLERARAAVGGDERFLVAAAPERRYGLANVREGIRAIATDPQDVVVTVDGDDWLRHRRVLEVLARVYDGGDVWTTYGSHQRWKGNLRDRLGLRCKRGNARPYPADVLDGGRVRGHVWYANHPRTFRRFLWDAIRDEDLRDQDGRYYRLAWDLAMAFPMLEMAGAAHSLYLHDLLYVYNAANPASDARVAREEQFRTELRIRARPPYPRRTAPETAASHGTARADEAPPPRRTDASRLPPARREVPAGAVETAPRRGAARRPPIDSDRGAGHNAGMQALRIVLLATLGAILYGIAQDQVTARICVEYFTIGHPQIVDSESPTVLALVWGVVATWWVGLPLGVLLAIAARAGAKPPLAWRDLVRPLAVLLLAVGAVAAAAGLVGHVLAETGAVFLVGPLATEVPSERHVAFLTDLWTHVAAYGAGLLGGLALVVVTWRRRARMAAIAR